MAVLDEAGFDDPLIDSVEVLLTLQQLDLEPWLSVAGYNVLDFFYGNKHYKGLILWLVILGHWRQHFH